MSDTIKPIDKFSDTLSNLATDISSTLSTWKGNFVHNSTHAFDNMSPKKWIRLVVIVCAYLLLRPYLLKMGAKVQEKQLEKAAKEMEKERATKISGNDLRGIKKVDIPGVDSGSEEEDGENKEQWGRKARLRQRKIVKKAMEIHEQNLRDKANESDKDIEDLLED